jgi:hypothetical protein
MIEEYCKLTGISAEDILGRCRRVDIAIARAMYWRLLYNAGYTYSEIGRMNDRTHATVLQAVAMANGCLYMRDKRFIDIYQKTKHLTNKYMSGIDRKIQLLPPITASDSKVEEFEVTGIRCEHCNGRGHFTVDSRDYKYDPEIGEVTLPCPFCADTGRLKAVVRIEWVAIK